MSLRPGDLLVTRMGARFRGFTFPCAIGRGGIGDKRGEGDGITPRGVWRITGLRWRPDRGPAPAPALPIRLADGWSDDPADPAYNRPVHLPHPFGHERLWRADPLYDLIAETDFNAEAVPGRGSAIFLHVWRGPRFPTAGCIAFRRPDLARILAGWTAQGRIVIR